MIDLTKLNAVCLVIAVTCSIVIGIFFTYQCLNFHQLNYDLYGSYSVLTKVGFSRITLGIIVLTILGVSVFLDAFSNEINKSIFVYTIGAYISAGIPFLHLLFFVLRLYMTFLNTNYPISRWTLLCYLSITLIVFILACCYAFIPISIAGYTTGQTLFWALQTMRVLMLLFISLHFSMKLISLIINQYNESATEMSRVGMLNYENFYVLNNLNNVHSINYKIHNNNKNHKNHKNHHKMGKKNYNHNTISVNTTYSDLGSLNGSISSPSISLSTSQHQHHQHHHPAKLKTKKTRVAKWKKKNKKISFSLVQLDLIKIVTKQSVLTIADFVVLASYVTFIVTFYHELFGNDAETAHPAFGVIYIVLVNTYYVVATLTVWLSFSFADKQYYCICKLCDKCCLNVSKCVTRNRINHHRYSNGTVRQDFHLDL